MKFVLSRSLAVFAGLSLVTLAALAQTMSAKDALQKSGLLATFSADCTAPASKANGYIVYRALDASRVQRDSMNSPTSQEYISVAETAYFSALNEITINGTADGKRLSYTLRVEGPRHRVMQWTEDGKPIVVDGVWVAAKFTMPWVTKCG